MRDHVRGSRGPTLLVFGDYECPYTRAAYRSVQALEAEGVPFRFAFRHFPLVEIHPHALAAAEASEAAAAQGRFWPMHDLLFRRQQALERADLEGYADEIGLDAERFRQELGGACPSRPGRGRPRERPGKRCEGHADDLRRRAPLPRVLERAELRRALAPAGEENE